MARRSQKPRDEKELAEFFEERRGDMSLWAEEPSRARVRKGGTIVFSIRLTVEELELLRQAAATQGITISELTRRATLESLQQPPRFSPIRLETPGQKAIPALGAGTANMGSVLTNPQVLSEAA